MLLSVTFGVFTLWIIILVAGANVVFYALYKLVWSKKKNGEQGSDLRLRNAAPSAKEDKSNDAIEELRALDERVYVENTVIRANESITEEAPKQTEQKTEEKQDSPSLSNLPSDDDSEVVLPFDDKENNMSETLENYFSEEEKQSKGLNLDKLSEYNYVNEGFNNKKKRVFAKDEQLSQKMMDELFSDEPEVDAPAPPDDEPDAERFTVPLDELDDLSGAFKD